MEKIKIQIVSWLSGSVLFEYECADNTISKTVEKAVKDNANLRYANLRYADLSYANLSSANLNSAYLSSANLSSANLRYADLRYADLRYANLRSADLRYANLRYANLRYADLRSAYLRCAKNLLPYYKNDNLSILRNQKNKLIAYKYLNENMQSPVQSSGKIEYKIGATVTEKNCNKNEFDDCGEGLNVATLEWCIKENNGNTDVNYIEVEFDPKDIVAIPWGTDGKFRISKLKVIRKLTKKELKKYITPIKETK